MFLALPLPFDCTRAVLQLTPPSTEDEAELDDFARKLFRLFFHDEIKNKLEMKGDTYKVRRSNDMMSYYC